MSVLVLRVAVLVVLVALGAAVGVVGLLGWRGRLRRGGRLGVRTPSALRGEEAFRLANRVAGPPAVVAGGVAVASGISAAVVPGAAAVGVVAVIGLVGAVLIVRAGGVLGDRAARTVPAPVPPTRAAGCGGCACGSGGCAVISEG